MSAEAHVLPELKWMWPLKPIARGALFMVGAPAHSRVVRPHTASAVRYAS